MSAAVYPLPVLCPLAEPIPPRKVRAHRKTPRAEHPWTTHLRQADYGDNFLVPCHLRQAAQYRARAAGWGIRWKKAGFVDIPGYEKPCWAVRVWLVRPAEGENDS